MCMHDRAIIERVCVCVSVSVSTTCMCVCMCVHMRICVRVTGIILCIECNFQVQWA